jgi:Na+-driven multidrug efflux pump
VRFPLAEIFLDKYHVDAIWWSFPVSSVLSSILALLYYKYGSWRSAHMVPAMA